MPSPLSRLLARLKPGEPASEPGERPAFDPPPLLPENLRPTLPGWLVICSAGVLLVLFAAQLIFELPEALVLFRRAVWVVCLVGIGWLVVLAFVRGRRALLWPVRRKLILSYVFLGVVPIGLITAFLLVGGMLLYMTVVSYVFLESMSTTVQTVREVADTTAVEIRRRSVDVQAALDRRVENLAETYPELSLAVVPVGDAAAGRQGNSGVWRHVPSPTSVPEWVVKAGGFAGAIVYAPPSPNDKQRMFIRAAVLTADRARLVIADLPVDQAIVDHLRERTAARLEALSSSGCGVPALAAPTARSIWALFRETDAFMDCTNWQDGSIGAISMRLDAPVGSVWNRLASVRSTDLAERVGDSWWRVFVQLLVLLAVLALIIQGAALVMGAVLARSITSAVHELFVGTERVREGDFSHRIPVYSRDQLGHLSDSFNRMSMSMEHLLAVQREKQRLDDELRIAREIQRSLLPVRPPTMAGLRVSDLCEPAREVGGDYYDFFRVGPRQLGVLIADVSGKGTSAALYMAELKGLMLALSHRERSPRQLLINVNRRLADQLDNRSFITMTYVVIDLEQRTLTMARAGHTPLILVSEGKSESIAPAGMVVGLRLPGADTRFEDLLVEHTQPIHPNDLVVLYTDGITEAMDASGELYGMAALERVLAAQQALDPEAIQDHVVREIETFVGGAEPHDDMTMVVIKIDRDLT